MVTIVKLSGNTVRLYIAYILMVQDKNMSASRGEEERQSSWDEGDIIDKVSPKLSEID